MGKLASRYNAFCIAGGFVSVETRIALSKGLLNVISVLQRLKADETIAVDSMRCFLATSRWEVKLVFGGSRGRVFFVSTNFNWRLLFFTDCFLSTHLFFANKLTYNRGSHNSNVFCLTFSFSFLRVVYNKARENKSWLLNLDRYLSIVKYFFHSVSLLVCWLRQKRWLRKYCLFVLLSFLTRNFWHSNSITLYQACFVSRVVDLSKLRFNLAWSSIDIVG